ncbi:MAG: helix-turn-helix transcriptional regulator [Coriobacteriaceae bacterium]|nr:helix-turn-helix transcriptional regulator [Coriobacteriaceae bacterium]
MSQYDGLMKRDETCEYVCKKVGENIGRLREEHKVSQAELARRIEVSRPNLNKVESGNQNFSLDYLVLIANGLDIPIVEFFSGLEKESPRKLVAKRKRAANVRAAVSAKS